MLYDADDAWCTEIVHVCVVEFQQILSAHRPWMPKFQEICSSYSSILLVLFSKMETLEESLQTWKDWV
jgi:hypothetical protein